MRSNQHKVCQAVGAWAVSCFILLNGTNSFADAGEQRKQLGEKQQLERTILRVNEQCGTSIAIFLDWKSFSKRKSSERRYGVAAFCEKPLSAVKSLCRGSKSRAYIKKKVKRITCSYGGAKKQKLSIKKDHIMFWVDFGAKGNDHYARAALLKQL